MSIENEFADPEPADTDETGYVDTGAAVMPFRTVPLPERAGELHRQLKSSPTINDVVEGVALRLWDSKPKFRAHLEAVYDAEAVEGSMLDDEFIAAQMIRAENDPGLEGKNLKAIRQALRVFMRRYGISRRQRRNLPAGSESLEA